MRGKEKIDIKALVQQRIWKFMLKINEFSAG